MTPESLQTIIPLSRTYPNHHGVPAIDRVAAAIFSTTYRCDFADPTCADACCSHGVNVDIEERQRILARATELEAFLGIPQQEWFDSIECIDIDAPGGRYVRTKVITGGCVFLDRLARGCRLHAYALAAGRDYHEFKPMLSALFPVTVEGGLLRPALEVLDRSLFCHGNGTPLYAGTRADLGYYYGPALLVELDELAQRWATGSPP